MNGLWISLGVDGRPKNLDLDFDNENIRDVGILLILKARILQWNII